MTSGTSRAWRVGGLLLAAGSSLWLAAGRPLPRSWGVQDARGASVLLVSLDTLRADRLGCHGYAAAHTPRLDALAARGVRFANATTVAPLTLPAHASLMTGTFPAFHGVRDNGGFYLGEEQTTLAEVLRERGYRTGGFVGAFVLDRRWGVAQGFERYFDDFDLSQFEGGGMDSVQRRGDEVVARAAEWLGEDRRGPFFAWVHLYDPHAPYDAPEPYRGRFPATASGAYDAEVAFTDALVGRLLDALDAQGRLETTLVAVVADHGEALGQHREQTHGFFVYDEALQVPLILAGPGLAPAVVSDQVRIVDVAPTILELVGAPTPAAVQGSSLVPLARGERRSLAGLGESFYPRYHYGWSELVALRDGRYKLIRAPRRELYDLRDDPGEERNLADEQPERAARMAQALEEMLARVSGEAAARGPQQLDAETAEGLQALGYVAGNLSARHLEERPRGDPKDKIDLYNQLKKSGTAAAEGRMEDAIVAARAALAEDPGVVEGHMLLGNYLRKAGRPEESLGAYREALALDPEHRGALYNLAVTYKDMGRLEDARLGLERARELDPRNGRVLWQLADLHMQARRFAEAESLLVTAIGRGTDLPRFRTKLGECYIEMQRWDAAGAALREALLQKPDQRSAHYNLALVHEGRGEPERAVAEYEAELALSPKAFKAAFNLARLLQRQGRFAEAARRFRQAIDANPEFASGYLYLAKALLDQGELDAAEEAARQGLGARPDPKLAPLGHYVLADVYTRLGRGRDAERERRAARRLQAGG